MSTRIRPELSSKNKYKISKHRYYELYHFCLQYKEWKEATAISNSSKPWVIFSKSSIDWSDPVGSSAISREKYLEKISWVEKSAKLSDPDISEYIIKAVTEGLSYNYLRLVMEMPCGRDMFYDRYRKFYWILDKFRT